MSQYPRFVRAGVSVRGMIVRAGTVVDVKPGSSLEAEYGGSGNLSAVVPTGDPRRSPEAAPELSKEALAN